MCRWVGEKGHAEVDQLGRPSAQVWLRLVSLAMAALRLTWSPSTSPSQPLARASVTRSRRLRMISDEARPLWGTCSGSSVGAGRPGDPAGWALPHRNLTIGMHASAGWKTARHDRTESESGPSPLPARRA
jgi:hypothetical protein